MPPQYLQLRAGAPIPRAQEMIGSGGDEDAVVQRPTQHRHAVFVLVFLVPAMHTHIRSHIEIVMDLD
jgi:hypothetical protein